MTISASASLATIHAPLKPANAATSPGDSREKSQGSAATQVSSQRSLNQRNSTLRISTRDDSANDDSSKSNDTPKASGPPELPSNRENMLQPDDERFSAQSSFESVLSHAIVEASPAPLILNRNSKLTLAASGPEPKRDASPRAIETTMPEAAKPINRDPLPLAIFFSLSPTSGKPEKAGPLKQENAAVTIDTKPIEIKKDEAPRLTMTGESAFTARIKISDQTPFEIPQARQQVAASPAGTPAPTDDPKKGDAAVSSAKLASVQQAAKAVTAEKASPGAPLVNAQPVISTPASTGATGIEQKAPAPVKAATPVAGVAPTPPVSTTPLKEISFQLPGAGGVEVKLTETAGQVRVDVRSADAGLTQDLRGNLHELVTNLEKKGFASEVNHPIEAGTVRTAEMNASKNSSSEDHGDSSGRQQQERQQQERQHKQDPSFDGRSQKSRATAWNDAIASNLETRES